MDPLRYYITLRIQKNKLRRFKKVKSMLDFNLMKPVVYPYRDYLR